MKFPYPILFAALALLFSVSACKKEGLVCHQQPVSEGCIAQCSRIDKAGDVERFCTTQLVMSKAGENVIMQKDIKRMHTRKLSSERCFAVTPDGKIADNTVIQELTAACEGSAPPPGAPTSKSY